MITKIRKIYIFLLLLTLGWTSNVGSTSDENMGRALANLIKLSYSANFVNDREEDADNQYLALMRRFRKGSSKNCLCSTEYRYIDMGKMYVPSRIPTAICDRKHCLDSYSCVPINYRMPVKKYFQDPVDATETNSWMNTTVDTTIACKCQP